MRQVLRRPFANMVNADLAPLSHDMKRCAKPRSQPGPSGKTRGPGQALGKILVNFAENAGRPRKPPFAST